MYIYTQANTCTYISHCHSPSFAELPVSPMVCIVGMCTHTHVHKFILSRGLAHNGAFPLNTTPTFFFPFYSAYWNFRNKEIEPQLMTENQNTKE